MLKVNLFSPESLLRLLKRFNICSNQVKQIQSLLITNGHLMISDRWINTLLYNNLIRTYLNLSQPHTSLLLFIHMLQHQAPPNDHTFPSVLKATVFLKNSSFASSIGCSYHAQCVKRGLLHNHFVQASFLSLFSEFGDMSSACRMFDEMPRPCIVSYNAMLAAFGKSGDMGLAVSMFLNMPERDIYSWTSVINACMRKGRFREAIAFFSKMMVDGYVICGLLRPNEATFVSILSACANLDDARALCLGKQVHGYLYRNTESNVFLGTALISFYGKTGCLNYAIKIFDWMTVKEACTWNAIICSMASNGREKQALRMFEAMKDSEFCPNEVTFVGVLSACARTKLVDLGLEMFRSMTRDFAIIPNMEHYGCVVDLLGRAGLLKEAYEFVGSMPFEADASVWGALLSACRVYGAVELGNKVGKRVLELEPQCCGRYVVLSSIFAGANRWDDAAVLRQVMVDAGIQKVPAFSMGTK
ncbi:putative pentatricopeptide repeat-containing protein At1g10330 [Primulina huaijiensis]|uniref:putative pentatricopeptide repeat-containing protein At1g10330 n=1 Tax=Primulina huaijiensis TaxID=1492673 RepID=UPI003CC70FC0